MHTFLFMSQYYYQIFFKYFFDTILYFNILFYLFNLVKEIFLTFAKCQLTVRKDITIYFG